MRTFRISERIEIVCESQSTRSGFRHLATLLFNGIEQESTKVCYLNRTWERFEFQTVAKRLIEKSKVLSDDEKKMCSEWLDGDRTDWSAFKTVNAIAQMGELFCDNQKDKNDWKARMLKAGLENQGLQMPDDWDNLDEDTKTARLDKVMEHMGSLGVSQ